MNTVTMLQLSGDAPDNRRQLLDELFPGPYTGPRLWRDRGQACTAAALRLCRPT